MLSCKTTCRLLPLSGSEFSLLRTPFSLAGLCTPETTSAPMVHSEFPGTRKRYVWFPVCLFLSVVAVPAQAELLIEGIRFSEDQVVISFQGEDAKYFILEATENLGAPFQGRALVIGGGSQQFPIGTSDASRTFFRIQSALIEAPLDSDEDGIHDLFELEHSPILNPFHSADASQDADGDGRSNLQEFLDGTDPGVADGAAEITSFVSSPADGADGIAVTRETVLRFSRPLSADLTVASLRIGALAAGQALPVRLHMSRDRQTVTVFYPEGLPGSSAIRVVVGEEGLLDQLGKVPDLDGDGKPGGLGIVRFRTLSLSAVMDTAVMGRVFASGLGDDGENQPLAGVKITVDGRENQLFAVTDAMGNFRLAPAPSGRFFVHIDGRTATGSDYPEGDYYPFVGKSWEAVAGEESNVGEVYLPLIKAGTLHAVDERRNTVVTFAGEVTAEQPQLEGVMIQVPPDGLFSDDGTRGGRVGIAPVAPDRLPGPLPEDLEFPLVITVQTDGPTNFEEPVPVVFPNLPDPVTGQRLPAGAKSALWSFNHDSGAWEIAGPMTVTPRGDYIISDPGVGILAPGWHGTQPGSSGSGGETEEEPEDKCTILILGPIAGEKEEPLNYATSIRAEEGGTWEWSAPGGNPSSGSGPEFNVSYTEDGTYAVTVRYVSLTGETCTDRHEVEIGVEECEVGILGPVDVALGVAEVFTAQISPEGGTFRWTARPTPDAEPRVGSEEQFSMVWFRTGQQTVQLEYNVELSDGTEATCTDQVNVFVNDTLCILDYDSRRLISSGIEIDPGQTLRLRSNLSSNSGQLTWTSEGGDPSSGTGEFHAVKYDSPGTKVITLHYQPSDDGISEPEPPQTKSLEVNVRLPCNIEIQTLSQELPRPVNEDIEFVAMVEPEGGTISWRAPGAEPSSGSGLNFSAQYREPGRYTVFALYEAPNGEQCEARNPLFIGELDCELTIVGPRTAEPGEVLEYSVTANHDQVMYFYRILGGETLGLFDGFFQTTSGAPLEFGASFDSPGTHEIRITAEVSDGNLGFGSCSETITVTISEPASASNLGVTAESNDLRALSVPPEEIPSVARTFHYLMFNVHNGRIRRGRVESAGTVHAEPVRFPSNTRYLEFVLDAQSLKIGRVEFESAADGEAFEIPTFVLRTVTGGDTDNDGLSAQAEFIVGTDPENPDTDGDGLRDGAEVVQGLDPLDGKPARVGIVASLNLPDTTGDICTVGDFAVTANGSAGVAIVNIFNGLDPVLMARINTPGEALGVACDDGFVAVACGEGGLVLIRMGEPADESSVLWTARFSSPVFSVEVVAGVALAGLENGMIVGFDLETGQEIGRLRAPGFGPVYDLAFGNGFLHAVSGSSASVLQLFGEDSFASVVAQVPHVQPAGMSKPFWPTFFIGTDIVYLTRFDRFQTYVQSESGTLTALTEEVSARTGWSELVPNGTGLGLAAVGLVPRDDLTHHIDLYDLSDPALNNAFLERIETSGFAQAVELANGLAYVADGEDGLQVINYLPFDTGNQPPLLELMSNFAENVAEENAILNLTATVQDDAQTRKVEFFLDERRVACDGNYPFEFQMRVPSRSERNSFTISARATDTGGNESQLVPLQFEIVEDATPPRIQFVSPGINSVLPASPEAAIQIQLSEAVDEQSVQGPDVVVLVNAGADGFLDTDDDEIVSGTIHYKTLENVIEFVPDAPLLSGLYRVTVTDQIRDFAGNQRSNPFQWQFRIPGPEVVRQFPSGPQPPDIVRQFVLEFDRDMDLSSFADNSASMVEAGPDALFNTPDDVPVPGKVFPVYEVVSLSSGQWVRGNVPYQIRFIPDQAEFNPPSEVSPANLGTFGGPALDVGRYRVTFTGGRDLVGNLMAPSTSILLVRTGRPFQVLVPTGAFAPDDFSNEYEITQLADGSLIPYGRNRVMVRFDVTLDPDTVTPQSIQVHRTTRDGPVLESPVMAVEADRASPSETPGLGEQPTRVTLTFPTPFPWDETLYVVVNEGMLDDKGRPVGTQFVQIGPSYDGSFRIQPVIRTVSGRVVDENGAFLGGVLVAIDGVNQSFLSTADGSFRIENALIGRSSSIFGIDTSGSRLGVTVLDEVPEGNEISLGDIVLHPYTPFRQTQVDAGEENTLYIDGSRRLVGWGANRTGQLGDGTMEMSLVATHAATEPGWQSISTGDFETGITCGIREDGSLWIWGGDEAEFGVLGGATAGNIETVPAAILSDQLWINISAGAQHVLAIRTDGTLWAWGNNLRGELGVGDQNNRHQPTQVGTDADWVMVSAGGRTSVAVKSNGTLWGWGENRSDQLLRGDTQPVLAPVQIGPDHDWIYAVASEGFGGYILAIKEDTTLWNIGRRVEGGVPDPIPLGDGVGWVEVRGGRIALGRKADGSLWGWRGNEQDMIFGPETVGLVPTPVPISSSRDWIACSAGSEFSVAIRSDGSGVSWGEGPFLGVEGLEEGARVGFQQFNLPVETTFVGRVLDDSGQPISGAFVRLGPRRSIETSPDGSFRLEGIPIVPGAALVLHATWYDAALEDRLAARVLIGNAQVGLENDIGNILLERMSAPRRIPSLTCGEDYVLAIKAEGTLWAWGAGEEAMGISEDQLNRPELFLQDVPGQVGTDTDWNSISSTDGHTLALKSDGSLWSWGMTGAPLGRAGTGLPPQQVGTHTDWSTVSAGAQISAAIKENGTLWTWGRNDVGQLGRTGVGSEPVQVGDDNDWVFVSAGDSHMLGIRSDGTLWGWGRNFEGQLGDGTQEPREVPTQVGTDRDWVSVVAARNFSLGLKEDGTLWAWGDEMDRLFFNLSSTSFRTMTVPAPLHRSGVWLGVDGWRRGIRALSTEGGIWAWGQLLNPDLADLQDTFRPLPVTADKDWSGVCAAEDFVIGFKSNGDLWSWGNSADGALGISGVVDLRDEFPPTPIEGNEWKVP